MRGPEHRNVGCNGDATESLAPQTSIKAQFRRRGFFPEQDPLTAFPSTSEFAVLDEIGRDLPSMLHDRGFRSYARTLKIPLWPENRVYPKDLPELRLYYVRVGSLPRRVSTKWARNRRRCCPQTSRPLFAGPVSC